MVDEEEETVFVLWNILQLLHNAQNRIYWVHLTNQKSDIVGFTGESRADSAKWVLLHLIVSYN